MLSKKASTQRSVWLDTLASSSPGGAQGCACSQLLEERVNLAAGGQVMLETNSHKGTRR